MITQPPKRFRREKKLIIVLIVFKAAFLTVMSYSGDEAWTALRSSRLRGFTPVDDRCSESSSTERLRGGLTEMIHWKDGEHAVPPAIHIPFS